MISPPPVKDPEILKLGDFVATNNLLHYDFSNYLSPLQINKN